MDVLIDTNILVRRINRHDPQYRDARDALKAIEARGDRICVAPQNIIEFWNVATRPADRNGLSLTPEVADRVAGRIEESSHMLTETIDVCREWRKLVVLHSVSGLKVYDARLVAVSIVHGLRTLLTFNVADFRRYAGMEILHPRELVNG